jgi:hypothetical protein
MKQRSGAGRHDLARVPEPVMGLPALATSANNGRSSIGVVAITDVFDERRRVRALARIDLLDRERRNGGLDEASYLVGREVEAILEPMSHVSGGGQWLEGDRVDGATQAELAVILGVDRARAVNHLLVWMVRHIGKADARLLWIVLGHGFSFSTASAAFGRSGVRGLRYTIDRFRDALATLADAKAARGRAAR